MDLSTALQVFVSPLLGTVFDNLSELTQSQFAPVSAVTMELEKLSTTLSTIQDVLEDAEARQIKDKHILNWLRKLKDLAYDADDVLDELATEAALNNSDQGRTASSFFGYQLILSRPPIVEMIEKLNQKFDDIAEEKRKFHLNPNIMVRDVPSEVPHHRETTSFLDEPHVYGREDDQEYVMNLLLNDTHHQRGDEVSVCAIQGMGGLGKTTLAQLVYNDERIQKHFEVTCWVCVSENFEPETILRAILEGLGEPSRDVQNLNTLRHRIEVRLRGKRFLFVFDDVWSDDQSKWSRVKSPLRCGGRGSSIIVTTRLETVASITHTHTLPICRPKVLSEENCWFLFKGRAFDVVNNEEIPPNLEEIGKEIVKKCGGIPLAAKTLGSLLRRRKKEVEWLDVRDSNIWDLPQDGEDAILPSLRLSYNHLPSHLKLCFAYCSIFPKDHIIKREKLIYLWMANGFIKSKGRRMEAEDVGNEIFNELSWRSFFQDFGKDKDGNILYCKMHDLVHDLACDITKDECSALTVGVEGTHERFSKSTRHLSLDLSWRSSTPSFLETSSHLRSLFVVHCQNIEALLELFSNLKYLRVLYMGSMITMTKVPDSICNLKHLRYLDLSRTEIRSLPNESFCSLVNLLILDLHSCYKLHVLPEDMWKLSNLRHLIIKGCSRLTRMPINLAKLTCLQTLGMFIVGAESGRGITELQELDQLRGELEIRGLEHVRNASDARSANLMRKLNLHTLSLFWSVQQNNNTNEEQEEVFEGLQLHPYTERLNIYGYMGVSFPSWMGGLSRLVKIILVDCKRCVHPPPFGQLPVLKFLSIERMDSLKYISHHHHHQGSFFPSLVELTISDMPNLEEWSSSSSNEENRGMITLQNLTSLSIAECPKLKSLKGVIRHVRSLRTLSIEDCRELEFSPDDFQSLIALYYLRLDGLHKMQSLPEVGISEQLTTTLEIMYISRCPGLTTLPGWIANLTSLRTLKFIQCNNLKHLPEGLLLPNLRRLDIEYCPELEFSPDDFQHFIALRYLRLNNLPKMTSLPVVGSEQLTSTLETLKIYNGSDLTLPGWRANLTSLHTLKIVHCNNLKRLPEGLRLPNTQKLYICQSHPDLHRRCEETGEDWHIIAHIPFIINIQ